MLHPASARALPGCWFRRGRPRAGQMCPRCAQGVSCDFFKSSEWSRGSVQENLAVCRRAAGRGGCGRDGGESRPLCSVQLSPPGGKTCSFAVDWKDLSRIFFIKINCNKIANLIQMMAASECVLLAPR